MKSLFNSTLLLLLMVCFPVGQVLAADKNNEKADIAAVKQALIKVIPQARNASVKTTPIPGLYEVTSSAEMILYTTKDASYIISGDMFDMKNNQKNLTEVRRGGIRQEALNSLGEDNMLVYTPEGEVKHTITVFTDIYCPYCQRLHHEMDNYMKNGVKVRYIFVPFKGEKSVNTSVSVWCAKDRNKAMDMAKSGKAVDKKVCDNPISKHQILARELGIRGTPAIMLESGQLVPGGYVPSAKLIPQLNSTL